MDLNQTESQVLPQADMMNRSRHDAVDCEQLVQEKPGQPLKIPYESGHEEKPPSVSDSLTRQQGYEQKECALETTESPKERHRLQKPTQKSREHYFRVMRDPNRHADREIDARGLEDACLRAENRAANAEERAKTAEGEVRNLRQQSINLNQQVRAADKRAARADSLKQQAEGKLWKVEALFTKHKEQAQLGMISFENEKQTLLSQLEQSQAHVRRLLDKALQGTVDGKWNPMPDEEFRGQLTRLDKDAREWSKRWAVKSLGPEQEAVLADESCRLEFWARFVSLNADGSLPIAIQRPSPKMKEKLPALLLNAALAQTIQSAFFSNPCYCVHEDEAPVLRRVLDYLLSANPSEAHVWRSDLWRITHPRTKLQTSVPRDAEVFQEANQRVLMYRDRIDAEFRRGPASKLLAPLESQENIDDRNDDLQELLFEAARIAKNLWTQRSYLEYLDLERMKQRNMAFEVQSLLLQGHPLSRVDEDDPRHNSRGVLIVTRPALLALDADDKRGLDSSSYRVLAKAIVWLEEAS